MVNLISMFSSFINISVTSYWLMASYGMVAYSENIILGLVVLLIFSGTYISKYSIEGIVKQGYIPTYIKYTKPIMSLMYIGVLVTMISGHFIFPWLYVFTFFFSIFVMFAYIDKDVLQKFAAMSKQYKNTLKQESQDE